MTYEESAAFWERYEAGLRGYTYLTPQTRAETARTEIPPSMSIQSGASVRLEYSVHDATGDLFETSVEDHGAVETVIGSGELPAGVESALIASEGDELQLELEGEDAYGEFDPGQLETVPRESFLPEEELTLGDLIELEFEAEEGDDPEAVPAEPVVARVIELTPGSGVDHLAGRPAGDGDGQGPRRRAGRRLTPGAASALRPQAKGALARVGSCSIPRKRSIQPRPR